MNKNALWHTQTKGTESGGMRTTTSKQLDAMFKGFSEIR